MGPLVDPRIRIRARPVLLVGRPVEVGVAGTVEAADDVHDPSVLAGNATDVVAVQGRIVGARNGADAVIDPVWLVVRSVRSARNPAGVSCRWILIRSAGFIIRSLLKSGLTAAKFGLSNVPVNR